MKVILSTERLIVSEVALADSSFILELLNSPSWIHFIGDKGVRTEDDAKNYIQNSLLNSYKTNGFGLYKLVLKESKAPMGLCGFLKRDYLENPDIGFALLPEFEGEGLMFEASHALLEYATSTLNFDEVMAIVMPTNKRSRQLLGKLGFMKKNLILPPSGDEKLLLYSNKKSHSFGAASS
ncbi:GNAT family N-acetyltransferase [Flagellimonas sediminis]|uniref:GNAT family N-acetyltransferase n=1 Tax=Flagellimonas sediminis TaxID=2696468 RepID=A0A6I5L2W2_9FLAO|nr:GNAT family N-acetyltransferase [Allomuricauda sediminis]NDV44478.1 GNAT family N-acetyltransferase [Allomuricauda sediminis]